MTFQDTFLNYDCSELIFMKLEALIKTATLTYRTHECIVSNILMQCWNVV